MKHFICFFSVIGLACIADYYSNDMSLSLDNPDFMISGEDLDNVNMEPSSQPSSRASSSAPYSGVSSRGSCPK